MKKIDLTGKRFGKLTVINEVERKKQNKKVRWLCKCDCGNYSTITTSGLRNEGTKSCGCLISTSNTTHGQWNTRLYNIYYAMTQRCNNKSYAHFSDYGGRGISVCKEWRESFESFYEWSMKNGYSDDLSIDRIDVNGNYEPSNCRWATQSIQSFNSRVRSDNNTGFTGISRRKDTGKYTGYINRDGKRYRLGCFDTLDEAIKAREQAEVELYGFSLIS